MRPELLGTPLDARFQPIQSGGGSIFPGAPILGMQSTYFQHEAIELTDTTTFDAHLSAWADRLPIGVRAGMGNSSDYRFATYRAYDVRFISMVDDRYPHVPPPQDALWYPARIHWGHLYEQICYGSSREVTSNFAAKFPLETIIKLGGGADSFAGTKTVKCKQTGIGLKPKPGLTFAGTPEEIRNSFDEEAVPIAPVFVEYRPIPGVAPPEPGAIDWVSPYSVEVRFNDVHIEFQTNWWTVNYYAQGYCAINGEQVATPTIALNGDEGTTGTTITTPWVATLTAAPGDRLSCGLLGHFRGTWKSGSMPASAMSEMPIREPETLTGSFFGSNADTRYTVHYTVVVSPSR